MKLNLNSFYTKDRFAVGDPYLDVWNPLRCQVVVGILKCLSFDSFGELESEIGYKDWCRKFANGFYEGLSYADTTAA